MCPEQTLKLARELHPELSDEQLKELVGDLEAFAQLALDVSNAAICRWYRISNNLFDMLDFEQLEQEFTQRLVAMNDAELVGRFNAEVGNAGWTSTRALFLVLLHKEFDRRGLDYSAIRTENGISFAKRVRLENGVIQIDESR